MKTDPRPKEVNFSEETPDPPSEPPEPVPGDPPPDRNSE